MVWQLLVKIFFVLLYIISFYSVSDTLFAKRNSSYFVVPSAPSEVIEDLDGHTSLFTLLEPKEVQYGLETKFQLDREFGVGFADYFYADLQIAMNKMTPAQWVYGDLKQFFQSKNLLIDPTQVTFITFGGGQNDPESITGWKHYWKHVNESTNLIDAALKDTFADFWGDEDLLDGYSAGLYLVHNLKDGFYDNSNELKLKPSEVWKHVWKQDYAVKYRDYLDEQHHQHQESFIRLQDSLLRIGINQAFNNQKISLTDYTLLLTGEGNTVETLDVYGYQSAGMVIIKYPGKERVTLYISGLGDNSWTSHTNYNEMRDWLIDLMKKDASMKELLLSHFYLEDWPDGITYSGVTAALEGLTNGRFASSYLGEHPKQLDIKLGLANALYFSYKDKEYADLKVIIKSNKEVLREETERFILELVQTLFNFTAAGPETKGILDLLLLAIDIAIDINKLVEGDIQEKTDAIIDLVSLGTMSMLSAVIIPSELGEIDEIAEEFHLSVNAESELPDLVSHNPDNKIHEDELIFSCSVNIGFLSANGNGDCKVSEEHLALRQNALEHSLMQQNEKSLRISSRELLRWANEKELVVKIDEDGQYHHVRVDRDGNMWLKGHLDDGKWKVSQDSNGRWHVAKEYTGIHTGELPPDIRLGSYSAEISSIFPEFYKIKEIDSDVLIHSDNLIISPNGETHFATPYIKTNIEQWIKGNKEFYLGITSDSGNIYGITEGALSADSMDLSANISVQKALGKKELGSWIEVGQVRESRYKILGGKGPLLEQVSKDDLPLPLGVIAKISSVSERKPDMVFTADEEILIRAPLSQEDNEYKITEIIWLGNTVDGEGYFTTYLPDGNELHNHLFPQRPNPNSYGYSVKLNQWIRNSQNWLKSHPEFHPGNPLNPDKGDFITKAYVGGSIIPDRPIHIPPWKIIDSKTGPMYMFSDQGIIHYPDTSQPREPTNIIIQPTLMHTVMRDINIDGSSSILFHHHKIIYTELDNAKIIHHRDTNITSELIHGLQLLIH